MRAKDKKKKGKLINRVCHESKEIDTLLAFMVLENELNIGNVL